MVEIVDQAAIDRINAKLGVLRRMAQVAIDQQGGLGFVEGERGGQVARDETAAGARADRRDHGDEIMLAAEREQARADLAERVGLAAHRLFAMDQAALLELQPGQRVRLDDARDRTRCAGPPRDVAGGRAERGADMVWQGGIVGRRVAHHPVTCRIQ